MMTKKRKRMKKLSLIILALFVMANSATLRAQAFVHEQSKASDYEWPEDPAVRAKLDSWQDCKFGVQFHWGLYSVPGIVESWGLCSEDHSWNKRPGGMDYDQWKKWYWDLKQVFNPVLFNPDDWAEIMEDAGMKYMIFTSKHHDGFCMFDSKYTDFSIAKWAFKDNPRRDVARHVWNSFRQKGFMLGCYFSKPDWHSEWFWNPYFATPNRHPNYKKDRYPEWWQNFEDYVHNQVTELMTGYGPLDILWLDGGWVKGPDIHLDELLAEVRTAQPGLIAVDRTARGRNENYQTPEQKIPATQLDYPWESCVTLTKNWGWDPHPEYKSPRAIIDLLAEITAKGGSLLLGVGPRPDGLIEEEASCRLREVGEWLGRCGKAIYSTRITPYYNEGNMWFTADKDGKTLYAIYALPDGEELPATLEWTGNIPQGAVTILNNGKRAGCSVRDGRVTISLKGKMKNEPVALMFQITRTQ